ncbi:hypothetical protein BT96DRAFT_928591 [Gymnopus androsaceus JB14]|uniref:F-box domain-containing protein n=1 Tax=Gymnopus androsaceus JB14 TaxID=1447944 RepID=A0A6A4GKK0_9AGAR|nr:hypothetical protein BT96DRAFT_928591 [Gymnopus androsaceus JB14]
MLPMLPEELLHSIVEYLAYKPRLPDERSKFKRASPELLSLSVVDQRLRRTCLPFLFANIYIRTETDAEKFLDYCSVSLLCPTFTKVLKLHKFFRRREEGLEIMRTILPSLKRLLAIDLEESRTNIIFLEAILEHPSVSTVLVRSLRHLPNSFLQLNMSKFVLSHENFQPHNSTLERWLGQGTRLSRLDVRNTELLDEEFGLRNFKGIEELNLFIHRLPVSLSWLPRFTSSHPYLHQLWLNDDAHQTFPLHTPSFIHPFTEEFRKQGFNEDCRISRVGLGRVTSGSQEWHVTGLTIVATSSLKEILALIFSSFPALEALSLDLSFHKDKYSFDDIVCALAPFSSLRTLSLCCVFGRLLFGCNKHWQPIRLVDKDDIIQVLAGCAETAVLSYTSRLAQCMTSLENCYIDDCGYANKSCTGRKWSLTGWLRVCGSQDVAGEALRVYAGRGLLSP